MTHSTDLDPYRYIQRRLSSLEREFVWQPVLRDSWVEALRSRLGVAIGLPERHDLPIDIETIESRDMGDYDRQTITYSTQPGLRAFAYLLTPKDLGIPGPAVICVPGHGPGVDALVGEAPADYQNQFAIQSVRAGFITLAIEPISFGHRKSGPDAEKGSSCTRDSMAALMLGESMIGWRCFDAMVAVDLLRSLPTVDPDRIGIMGISGGGLVAFWAGCLDERIAATVVSGYFNTFLDSILSIEHCPDNFAPGLAKVVEMPDMAALICPRKLFVESGSQDPIFPAEAFERACVVARSIYDDKGVSDAFGSDLFDGDHIFCGQRALPKLIEWLMA